MTLVTAIVFLIYSNLEIQWLWIIVGLTTPAVAIGESYRRNQSAIISIRNGAMALLGYSLITLLVMTLSGYDINKEISEIIRAEIETLAIAFQGALTDQQVTNLIQIFSLTIPFYLILVSVILSAITHSMARKACKYVGITIASMQPLRDWRLNKTFVWIYLVVMLLELFIDVEQGGFFATAIINLSLILSLTFELLGFGFILFYARLKDQRWVPWVTIVLFFILSPFVFTVLSLLGVFDTAFRIRERLQNSYERR